MSTSALFPQPSSSSASLPPPFFQSFGDREEALGAAEDKDENIRGKKNLFISSSAHSVFPYAHWGERRRLKEEEEEEEGLNKV